MIKVMTLCLLLTGSAVAQTKLEIKNASGQLDEATISQLKEAGLSDDMIKQLTRQLNDSWSDKEPKTQQQMKSFFDGYDSSNSEHYQLWYPKNYDPQKEIAQLQHAVKKFSQSFTMAEKKLQVVLFEEIKDVENTAWEYFSGQSVLPYFTSTNKMAQKTAASKALGHEACHLFLSAHSDINSTTESDGYGHGKTPDWFDETVAVSCEGPELQEQRLAHLNSMPQLPTLESFVTQDHPLMSGLMRSFKDIETQKSSDKKQKQGMKLITLKMEDDDPKAKKNLEKAATFYAMAYAVGRWIDQNHPESWSQLLKYYTSGGDKALQSLQNKGFLLFSDDDLI